MDKLDARLGRYAPYIDYLQRSELDHQGGQILADEIRAAKSNAVSINIELPITLLQSRE